MAKKFDINRVRFYSEYDMACLYEVDKILNRLRSINPFGDITDLNDVMELWNIHQYFKRNLSPTNLDDVDRNYLNDIVPKIQGIIVQQMLEWPKEDFENHYKKLSYDHQQDFWKIIVETKTYRSFNKAVLMSCIKESSDYALRSVLTEKNIVRYLNQELAIFLKDYTPAVEVLLDDYYISINPKDGKIFLPTALTMAKREEMIVNYINSPKRNLNYLRIISSIKNDETLSISDKTRLLCKRAEEEDNNKVLEQGHSIGQKFVIKANYKRLFPIVEIIDGDVTYNLACLKDIDASCMLFLLKNIFGFINQFGTIPLISLEHVDEFWDIVGMRGISCYRVTPSFNIKNKIALMQIAIIEEGLKLYGKSIEALFSSIIDVIKTDFGVSLNFNAPSDGDSALTKTRHLFAELDSILKQYQLYVEDGNIDLDLLTISSSPLRFNQIKSIVSPQHKYVELNDKAFEIKRFQNLLSSDNTTFANNVGNVIESLYSQLKQGRELDLKYEFQQDLIQQMVNHGILHLLPENKYSITPVGELLNILYLNDYVTLDRLPESIISILPLMEANKWISYSDSLLHTREANYFNYWLNKKDFTNGYDLRNKYMHGVQSLNEKTVESDYRLTKLLFILLLMKIIDDLELKSCTSLSM